MKIEDWLYLSRYTHQFFHAGFTVNSLGEAKNFFVEIFDAEVLSERSLRGEYLGLVLGEKIVGASIALLQLSQGPIIELVEYNTTTNDCRHSISNVGVSHLAHFVSNIDAFLEKARQLGAHPIGEINQIIPGGPYLGKRIIFLRTNFNLLLEIIEL